MRSRCFPLLAYNMLRSGYLDRHASEVGMNVQRRDFLLFVTLVVAAATPVWGQAAAPTASGAQSGASIPDVSGVWLHPSIPGFEPLSSGPTSVRGFAQDRKPGRATSTSLSAIT